MNMLLWVLQILLALHTLMGALWKLTSSEQTVSSLKAIPHEVWLALMAFELLCALGLLLPAYSKRLSKLVPVAAAGIAIEMLAFCGVHLFSGDSNYGPMIYWLVVAALCMFIAYGRSKLKPL
jgi:hypothetical protein